MIRKMNLVRPALLAALLCGVSAASALAQDTAASPAPGSPGPLTPPPPLLPPPPTAQPHHGPPPMPLFDALDTNHDGVISAEEIANASASLKALLKNGSDHLTREDLRPAGAPPPPAAAPGRPEADENAQPRPKIGMIRPHGPHPRPDEENLAAPTEEPRMHHPAPDQEQAAAEDLDRPHLRQRLMREQERMLRMQEEEMDEERPQPRHERMSRHQEPSRPEDNDQSEDEARPPRPEAMHEDREARPHHAPRPEETESRPAHHGPPPSPLFDALDTNHDGSISAEEIANASASLKALLKNGSDHLTRNDLRPAGAPTPPAER